MAQWTGTASGHTKPLALPVAKVRDVSIRRGVVQVCDFAPLTQLTLKEMIESNNLNRWSNPLKSDRSNLPGLNCWIPSCWVRAYDQPMSNVFTENRRAIGGNVN
jgi:hypothetical protein